MFIYLSNYSCYQAMNWTHKIPAAGSYGPSLWRPRNGVPCLLIFVCSSDSPFHKSPKKRICWESTGGFYSYIVFPIFNPGACWEYRCSSKWYFYRPWQVTLSTFAGEGWVSPPDTYRFGSRCFSGDLEDTLPQKINMEHKNHPNWKGESSEPNLPFLGVIMLIFQGLPWKFCSTCSVVFSL